MMKIGRLYVTELPNGSVRWSHRHPDYDALCVIVQSSGRAEIKSYGTRLATFHEGRDAALQELNDFEKWLDRHAKKEDRR